MVDGDIELQMAAISNHTFVDFRRLSTVQVVEGKMISLNRN